MKKIAMICVALTLVGCKNTTKQTANDVKKVVVILDPKSNSGVEGIVTFTEENGVVTMELEAQGLTPGEHAIHIHEKADCSASDGTSTGGHWNPTHQPHGKWGDPNGYHRGDIGNFTADSQGKATMVFKTDQWCLGCQDPTRDLIGHAVIIHEGKDDFVSQPTGDAGGRISCGGIIEFSK